MATGTSHDGRVGTARLGRPPAGDSAATRGRIVGAARAAFADMGYAATTNRVVARGAGVTTGALYHYFGSKLDLYLAVYDDVQVTVEARFATAIEHTATFVERLDALLDAAHELNRDDPALARFLGSVRVDARRDPELAAALRGGRKWSEFYDGIVDLGVSTGEIDPAARDAVRALVRTMLIGLTDAVSGDAAVHRLAVDALKALLAGTLLRPAGRRPEQY